MPTASERPHIVIVGTGIAGLTAAIKIGEGADAMVRERRLPARPDITMLEADTVVGGRARTEVLSNGLSVDAGPHWFHGGKANRLYQWATGEKHYNLGDVSLDTGKRRVNLASGGAMSADQREWGLTRLFEMYSVWQSQHPGQDIALGQLARMTGSAVIQKIADERAANWMAMDNADAVSADEFWGDDAGSGGMQLAEGLERLIDSMRGDAEYYGADIQTRTPVRGIFAVAGTDRRRFQILTDRKKIVTDHVIVTPSVGVLKSNAITFDDYTRSQLDPILEGMASAKMTKIFLPLGEAFFTARDIAPDTFLTFYDDRHSWLFHLRTDGKPTVTVFASGALSELVETMRPREMQDELFALMDRIPLLKDAQNHLDGRILRTDWSTNAHYLCAYSAMRPGFRRRNPLVVGNLIFAGEAWVENMKKGPTTMAGAFTSGEIAAKKTLRRLVP